MSRMFWVTGSCEYRCISISQDLVGAVGGFEHADAESRPRALRGTSIPPIVCVAIGLRLANVVGLGLVPGPRRIGGFCRWAVTGLG